MPVKSVRTQLPSTPRVLVTGCSSGIGRALVFELASRQYHVIASARRPETLADLPCQDRIRLDVASGESISAAMQCLGNIDILVNNAGFSLWGPVESVPVDQARELFDTNFFGAMRMSNAVLSAMRHRGSGLIIQISSSAGRYTRPLLGYYSASKHALEAASQALRLELAPFGVKVSCISVGAVASSVSANRKSFDSPDYAEITGLFQSQLLSKRTSPSSCEDVAKTIADIIADGGARFRYDGTEDSRINVAERQALSDEEYEAQQLTGIIQSET